MKFAFDSTIDGRLSTLGRKWTIRDSSGYEHADYIDGPTHIQGLLAYTRGVMPADLPKLLDPRLKTHMPDPFVLSDMRDAALILASAIFSGERIVIFGDYDVDGATSSSIVDRFLRMVQHDNRTMIIPNREFGYGFGHDAFDEVMIENPSVLILLDCGTQNHETIALARSKGISVVVVDHHQPSETLPVANALVNPHRRDESEEGATLRPLCTAGLAFVLCVAINRELRHMGYWDATQQPDLGSLLDLVALGTVCDVMPLIGLNRSFVINGLKRLDRRDNKGLEALAKVSGVKDGASATTLGFHLGPRINAGGRVGRARLGADLLASDDPSICAPLANQLNELNRERQAIEKAVQAEALEMIDPADDIIIVAGKEWHEGVIGIVAGRIKELHNRPVIVLTIRDDGVVKGSGRSIPGVDLGHAIMDAKSEGILVGGGGHMMACGLTMTPDRIDDLRAFLNNKLGAQTGIARDTNAMKIDAALWSSDLTFGFLEEIEMVGPYGQGWPKPKFILGPANVESIRIAKGGHAFFNITDDNGTVKAKAWRAEENGFIAPLESQSELIFAGHLEIDTWNGARSINFIVEDIMSLDERGASQTQSREAELTSARIF